MKKLFLTIALVFIAALFASAQTSECPASISATGPAGISQPNEPWDFTGVINGANNSKLEYIWTVSNGKIVSGKGTLNLKVLPDYPCSTVTATLLVKGLPESCPNEVLAMGEVSDCGLSHPKKIDEFSLAPPVIKKERLQLIAKELNDYSVVFITETFSRDVSVEKIRKKLSETFLYLTQTLKINPDRILWQTFGGPTNLTTIFIVPPGANLPDEIVENRQIRGENFNQDLDRLFPKAKKKSLPKQKKK